jgi:hypothetical protein
MTVLEALVRIVLVLVLVVGAMVLSYPLCGFFRRFGEGR